MTDAPSAGKHSSPGQYDLTPPVALNQSVIISPVKRAPKSGWRKFVHEVTGGHINLGEARDATAEQLLDRIQTPLRGDYRIAVMSLKGGVGKTTTTVVLGGVFANLRGDRVIAIDANPDLGTLAQRVAEPGKATIRDLLAAPDTSRYPQVRAYTTQAKSRLEVIGSERDPAVSEAFSEMDYRRAIDILQHHYNVILTDCGTGLMHSAMSGVLDLANTLVLVTSPALDGAQSASATLDWLNLHGYEQLAANSVVVISGAHPDQAPIDIKQLTSHFRSRTRAVQIIPFDRHLSEGGVVDLERISKKTTEAYHELAAIVAEDFDKWHRHASE
ncbi:MAG: MinD/ParA family protein [Corynebacterium sp.]|nr:MinD/ParA family protein [Corynebacterium sp.]